MTPYSFLSIPADAQDAAGFEFESPSASVASLAAGAVAVPLVNQKLIRASGADVVGFLHNLLSNDIEKLGPGAVQWNSLNSPKGRMIASLLMWRDGDDILISLSADLHPQVLRRLSMYVLRSKVTLSDASEDFALVGLAGAGATEAMAKAGLELPAEAMTAAPAGAPRCLRLGAEQFIALLPAAEAGDGWAALQGGGAQPAGSAAWSLALIRAGLPGVTAATSEEFVAQMLNFELIGGVSFTKGCYPGQEIVARTQYLGKLKKRTYRVAVADGASLAVGDELFSPEFGDQAVGKVVLAAPAEDGGHEALAVMQSSSAEGGDVRVGSGDGKPVEILPLPYALS